MPLEARVKGRTCGTCTACCVYLPITEIDKPAMSHCVHLDAAEPEVPGQRVCYSGRSQYGNCKINDDKPHVCAGYSCLWLLGYGLEADRPDRCLVLFDTKHRIANAVEAMPLADGACDQAKGRAAIYRMSKHTQKCVMVASFYERRCERVVGRPLEDD